MKIKSILLLLTMGLWLACGSGGTETSETASATAAEAAANAGETVEEELAEAVGNAGETEGEGEMEAEAEGEGETEGEETAEAESSPEVAERKASSTKEEKSPQKTATKPKTSSKPSTTSSSTKPSKSSSTTSSKPNKTTTTPTKPSKPKTTTTPSAPKKVSYAVWDGLLRKHVTSSGKVNYKGFKQDRAKLEGFLNEISSNPPQNAWSRNDKMVYWINAYNAYTVKLIIDNYPLKSITNLNNPWKTAFIKIGGKSYTLDQIENSILRPQFQDARIHFAVNCASKSCPKLLNEAFSASKVGSQMDKLARAYVNDPMHNAISAGKVEISKIFEWYKEDFLKDGSIIDYLNKYSKVKIKSNAKVSYKEYNWNLNE